MSWYKFVAYFALWAGALLNLVNGIKMLNGDVYEGYADMVYSFFEDLKPVDTIAGIAMIGLALFAVYVALQLLHLKKNAPKLLTAAYVICVLISIIYIIAEYSILKDYLEMLDAQITDMLPDSFVPNLIGSIVMAVVNYIYFKKRESLFVN